MRLGSHRARGGARDHRRGAARRRLWLIALGGSWYYAIAGIGLLASGWFLPGGVQANPLVFEAGGRQFVAIMLDGHHFMETPVSDALVAYALPQN